MFQKDKYIIDKLKSKKCDLTTGEKEYLIFAICKLTRLEKENE